MQDISKYLENLIFDDVRQTYLEYLTIEFSKLSQRPAKSKQLECLLEVKRLSFSNYQFSVIGSVSIFGQALGSWVRNLAAQYIAYLVQMVTGYVTTSAPRKTINTLLKDITMLIIQCDIPDVTNNYL